jgi:hypothetical protein
MIWSNLASPLAVVLLLSSSLGCRHSIMASINTSLASYMLVCWVQHAGVIHVEMVMGASANKRI